LTRGMKNIKQLHYQQMKIRMRQSIIYLMK